MDEEADLSDDTGGPSDLFDDIVLLEDMVDGPPLVQGAVSRINNLVIGCMVLVGREYQSTLRGKQQECGQCCKALHCI